jgi:DNA polymerase IV
MRIACVYLPNFYFQTERLKTPSIEGHPVIIGGMPEKKDRVADCSEEAAAQGVSPWMSLQEAYYRCPDALFLPFSGRYESTWEDILFALGAFSLRMEPEKAGLVYLDITRALKVYRDERALALAITREMAASSHLKARIGIGNSRFIAKQAALCAWDVLIMEPGGEKEFLSLLSIETLPLEEKEKEHLRLLGLPTLKKVAGLSQKALMSQFGIMGATLFDIVNGVDESTPIPRRQSTLCLEREFMSEVPLQTSEEMRPVMKTMVAHR